MVSRTIKTHLIDIQNSTGRNIVTVCGKSGSRSGGAPMRGHYAEYDTSTCDRFNATDQRDEVTCLRCAR